MRQRVVGMEGRARGQRAFGRVGSGGVSLFPIIRCRPVRELHVSIHSPRLTVLPSRDSRSSPVLSGYLTDLGC